MQEPCIVSDTYIEYWTSEYSTAEVDFVVQCEDKVYPIEMKAERNA